MIFYFETSAINKFSEKRSIDDALATRQLQQSKNRRWTISLVTLWELFLTRNEAKRDKIFHFSRFLFDDLLLPSPEEIIVNFVRAGCPTVEAKYPLISQGLFSNEWQRACKDKNYYFCPSEKDLKFRTQIWRMYGKFIDSIIRHRRISTTKHKPHELTEVFLNDIYESLDYVQKTKHIRKDVECQIRIAVFYTLIILCWGIIFDQATIEKYWSEIGIMKPRDRAWYMAKKFPEIIYRGPIAGMARMTYHQCKGKYSRGVFFDALHSIYTYYVDAFITNDAHFKELRDNGYDPNYLKIMHMDEIEWKSYPRNAMSL